MKPQEVTEALQLAKLKDKIWYVVPSCATTGEGLLEGLGVVVQQRQVPADSLQEIVDSCPYDTEPPPPIPPSPFCHIYSPGRLGGFVQQGANLRERRPRGDCHSQANVAGFLLYWGFLYHYHACTTFSAFSSRMLFCQLGKGSRGDTRMRLDPHQGILNYIHFYSLESVFNTVLWVLLRDWTSGLRTSSESESHYELCVHRIEVCNCQELVLFVSHYAKD